MTRELNFKNLPSMIDRALKKGDIDQKISCLLMIKLGYSNMALQELEIRNKKYNKLKKKYKYILEKNNYDLVENQEINNNIWICWFQGMENAPEIVKICYQSVKKYCKNYNIHVITKDNMYDYVNFPDEIVDKINKKIIPSAQLSDLIRTNLLVNHGGTWVDSTVLLTEELPKYIFNKQLFMFGWRPAADLTAVKNSWFIYAQKNNRILQTVQDLLFEFWKQENSLSEYFLWHMFTRMAFDKYPEDLENMYYVSEEMAHCLSYTLFKQFDKTYWEYITRISTIHKLSWHNFYSKDGKIPEDISDTFYEHIINL